VSFLSSVLISSSLFRVSGMDAFGTSKGRMVATSPTQVRPGTRVVMMPFAFDLHCER